jgi:hypothetical protein
MKIVRFISEPVSAAEVVETRTIKVSEKTFGKPIIKPIEEKVEQPQPVDNSMWERDVHGKVRSIQRRKHHDKFEMGQGEASKPQYRFKTNREIRAERHQILKGVLHSRLQEMQANRMPSVV